MPWQRQVLGCLHDSWKEVSDEPFDYENRVRYHLSLALRLLSTQCVGGRTKVSQQEQIASERMKQMLRFVEEHYSEELTVQLIADSVALSESACLRSFRQMLGITPIQYVKQYRVEKPPSCFALPGSRPARSARSAALQTAATLSRYSGRSNTVPPKNTA